MDRSRLPDHHDPFGLVEPHDKMQPWNPRRVAVIGSGYVGTVVAGSLAYIGHQVTAVEADAGKLARLESGDAPFHELGLNAILRHVIAGGSLTFTSDFGRAMDASDIVFVCVGTPPDSEGNPDMGAMLGVARSLATNLRHHHIIVTKSTVPIGTGRWLSSIIEDILGPDSDHSSYFSLVSNPEFLREGSAVNDFLNPDRVVLGSDDPRALDEMTELYRPITTQTFAGAVEGHSPVPLVRTRLATAEMIKYASNAFLATKISFANEIARLCDFVGADVTGVAEGMGLDSRIGPRFLDSGLGWGGSCFGKDLAALIGTAGEYGYRPQILEAAVAVNEAQRQWVVDQLLRNLKTLRGTRICLLGLAFKPDTDDPRDSPAVDIAKRLLHSGAFVTAYDPMVTEIRGVPDLRIVEDPYNAAMGADAIVVATEWPEFAEIDLFRMRRMTEGSLFVDGRNAFDIDRLSEAGFRFVGVGRPISQTAARSSLALTQTRM